MVYSSPSPQNLSSSPPTKPTFSIKNVQRLSQSRWNNLSAKVEKPVKDSQSIFQAKLPSCSLSSDPITAQDLEPKISTFTQGTIPKIRKRKCPDSPLTIAQPKKVVTVAEMARPKIYDYDSIILEARDLLVKAYSLTDKKDKKDAALDLIEVFRNFTEEGRIQMPVTQRPSSPLSRPATPEHQISSNIPAAPSYAQVLGKNTPAICVTQPKEPASGMKILTRQSTNIAESSGSSATPALSARIVTSVPNDLNPNTRPTFTAHSDTNLAQNVITLVTKSGCTLPIYQPFSIRESFNKILGKKAISRVHTSAKGNLVLTCWDSTPNELLLDQEKWETIFADWPVQKAQKITHWPKLVVYGVPTGIPIQEINQEIESFNDGIQTQGQPRWLTKSHNQALRATITFSVTTEDEKVQLLKNGVLIGGLLLRVANYQLSTQNTQCHKCLTYGHHQVGCTKQTVCAICLGGHMTSNHSCVTCKASQSCIHHALKCANCNSNTHLAFQQHECDYYKALAC